LREGDDEEEEEEREGRGGDLLERAGLVGAG
jgi:hypothetical protein